MKILHVIDNLKLGGTQNLAVRTWQELASTKHDLMTCVLVNSKEERACRETPPIIRLAVHGDYRKPFAIQAWAKQLANVVQSNRPDIIHSWLWLSDIIAANAAAKCHVPHVVHIVDRRNWQQSSRIRDRIRRWATRRAFRRANSSFLAVSKAAGQFAVDSLGIDASRLTVAYNSIHPEAFAKIPASTAWMQEPARPLKLGIAARIEPEKGHQFLIDAMDLLRARKIPCSLQITGDGTDRTALEQRVAQKGLEECVKFVGWVDDVAQFLTGIDVFVVPSIDSEGLPTTILEAMAAGRIVVATDVGGAIEAIEHQSTGFIIKPQNPAAIADCIESISANREATARIADAARRAIDKNFSMSTMMHTIETMYARVCHSERTPC